MGMRKDERLSKLYEERAMLKQIVRDRQMLKMRADLTRDCSKLLSMWERAIAHREAEVKAFRAEMTRVRARARHAAKRNKVLSPMSPESIAN